METKQGVIITIMQKSGYGFIQPDDDQKEIFFRANGVCGGKFEDLREGMPVNYLLVEYEKKGKKRRKAIGVVTV